MSVSLFSTGPAVRKSEDGPAARAHVEAVQRFKNAEAARADVTSMTLPFGTKPKGPRDSSGKGQLIAGAYPEHAPEPVKTVKADIASMSPRAKAHAASLSPNAARLLDLMTKADDAHRGAQLIQAPASDIGRALSLKLEEAEAARRELEARGLIEFRDNHSGDRGYRVRA